MAGEIINKYGFNIYKLLIIGELLLFLGILGTTHKCSSDKIDILEHNIMAYRDSLNVETLKNGDLLASKASIILEKDEALEELNIAKSEIKEIEKKLDSKIAQINKLTAQLSIKDTIKLSPDSVYITDNELVNKSFNWENSWTTLSALIQGKSILDSELSIYDMRVKVPIEFGITNDYKIWVKSSNPNVIIEDVTSATIYGSKIYPKPVRFHHGIHIGIGLNYGMINKTLDFGPTISYGFTYSF